MIILNISAEWLAHIVTIIGLPFAIGTYIYEKRKEWKAEEEKLFDELDDGYIAFMNLAVSNPDLDLFATPRSGDIDYSSEQLNREEAVFGALISLFERCYLMFRDQSNELRESQWNGWETFMRSYACRQSFVRVWRLIGHQFDSNFVKFLDGLIREVNES